jgi:hypothetical protein
MLMVIFGAGASFDSIDSKPPGHGNPGWDIDEEFRPPLANDLFGPRKLFADAMARFEKLQPIVPLLRHTGGRNIEGVLRELQLEADQYPERHCQLMAVRYYLHYVLWQCERNLRAAAKEVTNYKALLDNVNRWRKPDETVCLVTFNYDTLLEHATPVVGLTITDLNSYVVGSSAYKVFKLHGSTNWARTAGPVVPYHNTSGWAVAQNHIERAANLMITDEFVQVTEYPCGLWGGRVGLVPAIAIPVEKKAYFECPKEHLRELERMLPQVDRLLLIGWRATEDHFLELIDKHLKRPFTAQIVTGSNTDAQDIADRLKTRPFSKFAVRWELAGFGFTDYIINQRADTLLSVR